MECFTRWSIPLSMNSVSDLIKLVFVFFVFLAALAYTVFSITELSHSYDELPTSQTVYSMQTEIPEEVYWTGAQVVGKLYRLTEDNVPIQVGSRVFATDIDVMDYQHEVYLNAFYKKELIIDGDGEITSINFTIK